MFGMVVLKFQENTAIGLMLNDPFPLAFSDFIENTALNVKPQKPFVIWEYFIILCSCAPSDARGGSPKKIYLGRDLKGRVELARDKGRNGGFPAWPPFCEG